jgi:hypothetical protein
LDIFEDLGVTIDVASLQPKETRTQPISIGNTFVAYAQKICSPQNPGAYELSIVTLPRFVGDQ